MYKISVPIMEDTLNEQSRVEYLKWLKEANIERVFISMHPINRGDVSAKSLEIIRETAKFFKDNGIEPAVWVGRSIGHGSSLLMEKDIGEMDIEECVVSLLGTIIKDTHCPLNQQFIDDIAKCVQDIAKTGVQMIMLDDDFRMSQRAEGWCCCCDKHLALMSEKCGEPVTRELLRERAFKGGKNKYRDAWLDSQAYGLRKMAEAIRKAVDEVSPDICVGTCSAWGPWDLDGIDALELTKILAGKNKPFMRTLGAPYWATGDIPLPFTIEIERMFASFCDNEDVEKMSEGDPWPRPRYNCPASYVEVFDGALRAAGAHNGILKYMFDYVSTPEYETGYVEHHIHNLTLFEGISKMFAGGKQEGVCVCVYPHKSRNAEYPDDFFEFNWHESEMPYPSGNILATSAIPSVYGEAGMCSLIFGENIRYALPEFYEKGAILDAWSAKYLHEQGVDVGIDKILSFGKTNIIRESFTDDNQDTLIKNGACRLLDAQYKKGVIKESVCVVDGEERVVSYRYENAKGQKFFVLNFSVEEQAGNLSLLNSYARQNCLIRAIEWIADKKLPAKCVKHPQLYMVCKRKENSLAVGLFNCFADSILKPVIQLDKSYQKVQFLGTNGEMKGDEVILTQEIPAFGCVAFEVFD